MQVQSRQLSGHQHGALKGLWQQAAVIVAQQRDVRHELAEHQFCGGQAHFGGHANAPVIVGGSSVVVHRKQFRTAALWAAVELEAKHRDTVKAKTERTRGIARIELEDSALGPFFYLALAGARVVEITVEVVISQYQAGLGILEKTTVLSMR
ncbi:hypothetical protein D3C81_1695830 [compost metagenome]